jgi:peptidoglycan/LPS O-acetylase OafA/YrhL
MSSSVTAPDGRSRPSSRSGLRFLAALSVFLFHSSVLGSPLPPHGPLNPFADRAVATGYANALLGAGFLGMSFFLVLSGFVITWSSRPGEPVWSFPRRRVVKIYPNHIVLWTVCLPLFALASGGPAGHRKPFRKSR